MIKQEEKTQTAISNSLDKEEEDFLVEEGDLVSQEEVSASTFRI